MAGYDYGKPRATASSLLERFGQIGAIPRTVVTPPPNGWTPGTEATTHHAVTVVVLPISEKRINGTVILTGDKQALISTQGLSIVPSVGDVLMFNGSFGEDGKYTGEAWTIAKLDTLAPAGVTVLYDAVVRR